ARRGAAAAAVIPDSVLSPIRVIGMTRPETVGDVAVILGALVDVVDHQLDRRAGGLTLEDPGQDLDLVGLAPLRRIARLPRPAPVEPLPDVGFAEPDARRHALHH